MDAIWVVIIVFVVLGLSIVWAMVKVVPRDHVSLIERLGKYRATLQPGVHLVIPFMDQLRSTLDTREQVLCEAQAPTITRDNRVVLVDTAIHYRFTDPRAAVYDVADHERSISRLTVTTLRDLVGALDLRDALTSRDVVAKELRRVLSWLTEDWGVRVARVDITAMDPAGNGDLRSDDCGRT